MRMETLVSRQVDSLHRLARASKHRERELALSGGESEHGPAVVAIAVQIQEAGGRETPLDRLEDAKIAPLAHIGNSDQKRWI